MADSDQQKALLDQFKEVSGVNDERAKFYLEAANWDLGSAMGSFFEESGMEQEHDLVSDTDMPPPPPAVATRPNVPKTTATSRPTRSGLATLDSIRRSEESESSDDDDNKQAFYAGGSESSGQQVLGPGPASGRTRDEMIAEMFKKARELGAKEPPQMFRKKSGTASAAGGAAFGGTGYKLGDSEASSSGAGAAGGASAEDNVPEVVLQLWSEGFTVDGGPLRSYRDPANAPFLEAVKRGEVPRELQEKLQGKECSLSIMDKHHEDYTPPKNAVRAFTGKGQMLGSPAPAVVTSNVPTNESDRKTAESEARNNITLAPGEPVTTIQFRLVDGSRLSAQFNHNHTVEDLYAFVNAARPEFTGANYILTLFPNIQLTEKASSLKQANILNSALTQKIQSA